MPENYSKETIQHSINIFAMLIPLKWTASVEKNIQNLNIATNFKNQAERKFWDRKRCHFQGKEDVW
jgi:hypothetical protein